MPAEILSGTYENRLSVSSIRDYCILATLADKPVARGERQILIDIATHHVSADLDIQPEDVEVLAVDIMAVHGDESFAWEIEMPWCVWCDECEHIARVQTDFSANLCQTHLDDAYETAQADLENDDRAIGMRP